MAPRSAPPPDPRSPGSRGRRVLHLLLATLAATPFVYVPGFLYPAVVPRAAWFRVLVAAGLVVLAWRWRSPGVGWSGAGSPTGGSRRGSVALGLAAYAAALVASAVANPAPWQGLAGGMLRMGGAVEWISYLAAFVLLRRGLDAEGWPRFLKLVAGVTGAVAAWSLLQAYGESLGLALVGWSRSRVVGTLGLAGPLGAAMVLGASISAFLAARADGRRARIGWALLAAAELWVMLLSGTRAALLGAAAAALAVGGWILWHRRGAIDRPKAAWTAVAGAAALAGLALVAGPRLPGLERLLSPDPGDLFGRVPMWRTAVAGFLEHPLLGVGPENFDWLFDRRFRPDYYLAGGRAHQDQAHSLILAAAAEAGVVGLAAMAGLLTAVLVSVRRALRAVVEPGLPWLAWGVLAYLAYLMLWFEDLTSFFLLLVVLAYLEHRRRAARDDRSTDPGAARADDSVGSGWRRWAATAGAVLLVAATAWYHAGVLRASRATRSALAAESLETGLAHYRRALAAPTATTRQVTSRLAGGLDVLASALERGQVDADPAVVEGAFAMAIDAVDAEIAAGGAGSLARARRARIRYARHRWRGDPADFAAAVRDLRRALEISPGRIRYLHRLARMYSQQGDVGRARELLDRALDRFPGWWETLHTRAQVEWDAGRREEAVELLRRAAAADDRRPGEGVGEMFVIRAGSWLEARGTPEEAVTLYRAYLESRYPGWRSPPGERVNDVPGAALSIAARLPITLLRMGRPDEARGAVRRLLRRLPEHLRRPAVTDRLHAFLREVEAGEGGRWTEEWGVLPTDVPLER